MQAKDISMREVLGLIGVNHNTSAFDLLCDRYPHKVVLAKYEKLIKQGYLDYGVSRETSWLTEKGKSFLVQ